MSDRAVVHVLFTGGTISMRRDPVTGAALPALSGREIVARVPGLRREARLRLEDLARLPGPHVTPAWMWRLRRRVEEVLADPRVDGVVITHGTDTLEETAYLLDLTVAGPKPVVLTGAMRTFSDPGWDGPANLTAAVRTAAHPGASGRGALVVFGEEIHAAARVRKAHTQRLDAFRSALGPLGVLDRGRPRFDAPVARGPVLRPHRLVTAVDLHVLAAGSDDRLLRASLASGAKGSCSRARAPATSPRPSCPASAPPCAPASPWSWCRAAPRDASPRSTGSRAAASASRRWVSSSRATSGARRRASG